MGKSCPRKQPEVWIVNQYAVTPDLPGGTRHYDLARELVRTGYSVRVFASDVNLSLRTHTKLEPRRLWSEQDVDGVAFVWIRAALYRRNDWRRAWNMVSFACNLLRVGLALRTTPDVVIGSSPPPFAAVSAWVVARLRRAKFVLELRDLWPQALVDLGVSEASPPIRLLRVIESFLHRVSSKVIVLASGSIHYLEQRGVPRTKVVYIPNGVHLQTFDGSAPQPLGATAAGLLAGVRERYRFPAFTLIYTGAHGPANALDIVLGAANRLRDREGVGFVLVGDGPAKPDLVRTAKERALRNVRFLDPVPRQEIPLLLRASDAAVITLRAASAFEYGISPNKLFEYMAAAKPVLCAVLGDMARLVDANDAGIAVAPEDPQALASAVERLLEMTEAERRAMGLRGRELVEREFSRERLAERLAAIL